MGIYHEIKNAGKKIYHAATGPRVYIIETPAPAPAPAPKVVFVERHTASAPPPPAPRTVFVERHVSVEERTFSKLSKIEALSHYHSYSNDYDYDNWDALKRFGRALTNIYVDGYCHRIAVSVDFEEVNYIRFLINSLHAPVIKHDHDAYRALAQEFLSKYRRYM